MGADFGELDQAINCVIDKANDGCCVSQSILASLLECKAIQENNPQYLDDAEYWYMQSAAGGHIPSAIYLENDWPNTKRSYLLLINNQISNSG